VEQVSYVTQSQAPQRVIMKLCFVLMTNMLSNPYIAEKRTGKSYMQYNEGAVSGWFTRSVGTVL
jgi:hypothetical protein